MPATAGIPSSVPATAGKPPTVSATAGILTTAGRYQQLGVKQK
jgi:hypothetical protein